MEPSGFSPAVSQRELRELEDGFLKFEPHASCKTRQPCYLTPFGRQSKNGEFRGALKAVSLNQIGFLLIIYLILDTSIKDILYIKQ
jgi:hypothetical protein